ncbi:MAG: membrane protein [Acidobacteria bacterium 13_1_40CM_4_58_4]|nr:MAG: membrane protein [Acidobacteria bacterium 13_1_40CM_4_58_4]
MPPFLAALATWLFASEPARVSWKSPGRLASRWLFLRALGLIFFSAFDSLVQQVQGLIGTDGLLPAGGYLEAIKQYAGTSRFWRVPTLFWFRSDSRTLLVLAWIGMIASLMLVLNFWPRGAIAVCLIAFLSFVAVLQTFSSYQSDGMLLSAGFISLFFAPRGLRPRWGERHPPSRASIFLLLLVWFTIYFESGLAKILGGDPEWRDLTAMDDYYQNGPLPTWIAWYAHHLPHWFHVGTAAFTLALELVLVWLAVLPRPFRIVLFWLVTSLQIGIILTGNYAFLNYLVLALGFLLLDDRYLSWMLPVRLRPQSAAAVEESKPFARASSQRGTVHRSWLTARRVLRSAGLVLAALSLTWIFYDVSAQLAWMIFPRAPLPTSPVSYLEPFRIANRYGPLAVITRGRYEIEFQGSNDGQSWTVYPFRYKPQDPRRPPGIFAPYQPRFDWNLWSASLDNWRQNEFVTHVAERLLTGSPSVLSLFAGNPFPAGPPRQIRAVIWQYWFTDGAEKQRGFWWQRAFLGLYAPTLEREADGKLVITEMNTIRSR